MQFFQDRSRFDDDDLLELDQGVLSIPYDVKASLFTSYLSHPENLIRKVIRSSKNLRIHPKFRYGGILENSVFLQLLIRNKISLIRRKNVFRMRGRTFPSTPQVLQLYRGYMYILGGYQVIRKRRRCF